MATTFRSDDLLEAQGGAVGMYPVYEPGLAGDFGIPNSKRNMGDSFDREVMNLGIPTPSYQGINPFSIVSINPKSHEQPGIQSMNKTLLRIVDQCLTETLKERRSARRQVPNLAWRVTTSDDKSVHKIVSLKKDMVAKLGIADKGLKAIYHKGSMRRLAVYDRKTYYFEPVESAMFQTSLQMIAPTLLDLLQDETSDDQRHLVFGVVTAVQTGTIEVLAHKSSSALLSIGLNSAGGFKLGAETEGFYFQRHPGVVGIRMTTFCFDRDGDEAELRQCISIRRGDRTLYGDLYGSILWRAEKSQNRTKGKPPLATLAYSISSAAN